MDDQFLSELGRWIIGAGLSGESETALLDGFCQRVTTQGLPLAHAAIIIDTLHPIHEGRAFRWQRGDDNETELIEYGRSTEGEAAETWRRSPFFHMLQSGASQMRHRLLDCPTTDYPTIERLRDQGVTDHVALINRFTAEHAIGEMDCVYSYWTTDCDTGFEDGHVQALLALMPTLALAVKCASLQRVVETLGETYLGRDAGRRVLAGRIGRGVAERIDAVLWYSDLRGFTGITDSGDPEQVMPLLNDYAEAVIPAIHEHGGDVLKLIGDGILAIFTGEDRRRACCLAISAEADMRQAVERLNRDRMAAGLATTHVYLGLHVGSVFYGNIGSRARLDFTVIGPAVNEVSRIAAMCRSAERDVLLSSVFVGEVGTPERDRIVSVGRYALRGVKKPQELFTLIPEEPAD